MKKKFGSVILFFLLMIFSTLVYGSEEKTKPIVIRFSHVVSETSPKGIGVQMFKDLAEQRLSGKVKVEVYPRSEKFTDEQAIIGLLLGDVEMVAPSFPKFTRFSKALQVFNIPFLFDDVDAIHKFQQSEAGRKLLSSMDNLGIKGLRYWDNGMRVLSANRPIKDPKDIKGLSFRIEPSHVFFSQYASLGATPMVLPYKQLPDGLKIGIVDGFENPWSNIFASKLYLLRKYYTEVNHSFLGYMVATSVSFWDGLPPDIRRELEQILDEVTARVNLLSKEKALADRKSLMQTGEVKVITLDTKEMQEWKNLLEPVINQYSKEIDTEILAAAKEAQK